MTGCELEVKLIVLNFKVNLYLENLKFIQSLKSQEILFGYNNNHDLWRVLIRIFVPYGHK